MSHDIQNKSALAEARIIPSKLERLEIEEKLKEPKSPHGNSSRWSNGSF